MKKIILAIEVTHFPEEVFDFIKKIHEQEPVQLTGVFLPQAQLAEFYGYPYGVAGAYLPVLEDKNPDILAENINRFEQLCKINNISYSIHEDFYNSVNGSLKKESNYADLLILCSQQFYNEREDISVYLSKVLHDSLCPAIVLPENAHFPSNLILAFDGSEDSIFAIKQFAYLFPALTNLPVEIVYVHEDSGREIPDKALLKEWVERHFSRVTFAKIEINPEKYFATWISERKDTLLVCGSFARSGFSNLLNKSFVREVIANHELPVFVAHY